MVFCFVLILFYLYLCLLSYIDEANFILYCSESICNDMYMYIYIYIYIYIDVIYICVLIYICIYIFETFYIVTNSFTLSLNISVDKKYYEKPLRTVILFIDNIFYNRFGKNVLNKQLWWSSNYGCQKNFVFFV